MNKFTVYFDEPFWVGVFERFEDGKLETARVVFGKEPKDYEVYSWVLSHYFRLRFSPPVAAAYRDTVHTNPKRMQREIRSAVSSAGVGTKAQQAMKLAQEAGKVIRQQRTKAQKDAEKQRLFALHIAKKKEKQKGH